MNKRIGLRIAPIFILAALALGACTDAEGAGLSDLADSLPQGVEVSLEDNSLEFTDVVNNIASDLWDVGPFVLGITSDTEIEPGIAVGDTVKVHALLTNDGKFVAREISISNNDPAFLGDDLHNGLGDHEVDFSGDELEFVGSVEAIGVDTWTIEGLIVLVTPETEIKASILVGDLVKVHAYFSDTGGLTAREIEPTNETVLNQDELDADNDMKFVGVIESIEGDTWVIGGVTFQVDENTEVDEDLKIGDTVEVYLFLTPDGLTFVREISSFDDDHVGEDEADDIDDDKQESEDDDDEDDHSGSSESEREDDGNSGSGHSEDD